MELSKVFHGRNSVLCDFKEESVLYEKLANTIHIDGKDRLTTLQERVELRDYKPYFETDSLRRREHNPLGMLLFEVTEQCNLGCSYCIYSGDYVNERTATSRNMSFTIAKKTINNLIPLSKGNVLMGFYGGEPLLNMGLVTQIMTYSKDHFPSKEFTFSMTTNFFHGDKHIQEIVDNGVYVNLSLDGSKEVHDKFRKTKAGSPTHERILSNLRKVEEYCPGYVDSHFFIISTCHDPNDLEKIVQFFDENNFFVSRLNGTEKKGKVQNRDSFPLTYDNTHLIKNYQQRVLKNEDPRMLRRIFDQDLKTISLRDKAIMPEQLMLNGSCYPGKRRIFIDVDGIYHPCERFGSRLPIGSVEEGLQQPLIEKYIEKFAKIRNSLCRECWAQRLCTPCLQYAKDPVGEISLEGLSQTCEGKRKQLLTALYNHITLIKLNRSRAEDYVKGINPLFERG